MSLISFTPVVDGTTAVASGVNTPFSTIYNDYNGNITNANIASGASIAFSKISGGTSTALTAWQSWVPSWTNLTTGNGTLTYAKYVQVGKTTVFRLRFVWGSTTSASGAVSVSLPATVASDYTTAGNDVVGQLNLLDNSAGFNYQGGIRLLSTTTVGLYSFTVSASNILSASVSSTAPFTFAVNDVMYLWGTYEAA